MQLALLTIIVAIFSLGFFAGYGTGPSIRSEDGRIACGRLMRGAVLNTTYVIATVLAMVAWIWMIADFASWAVGF
jgi:hypothetical protein